MKIQSSFKDYYDFVSNHYGGGDPKIVYVRNRIAPLDKLGYESSIKVEVDGEFPLYSLRDLLEWKDRETIEVAYLIVAGKSYLLMKKRDWPDDVNTFCVQPLNAIDEINKRHSKWWFTRHEKGELGKEYPFLVDLSRKIKAPVFVIRWVERKFGSDKICLTVAGQCPILKEIGIPSLIPAEQIYQELAYFVGNMMKDHPDTEPPVEVSNTSKILNAGFDLKQSFRHRAKE